MNIGWSEDISHEIREAIQHLRESGADYEALPSHEGFVVCKIDGEFFRKVEKERPGYLFPFEDETEFAVTF